MTKMVQALDLERLNPALDECVHVRSLDGRSHDPHLFAGKNLVNSNHTILAIDFTKNKSVA
jgi:hypothetical protein